MLDKISEMLTIAGRPALHVVLFVSILHKQHQQQHNTIECDLPDVGTGARFKFVIHGSMFNNTLPGIFIAFSDWKHNQNKINFIYPVTKYDYDCIPGNCSNIQL